MPQRIDIEAEPREDVQVKLVGTEYLVKPPKGSTAINMAKQAAEAEKDDSASSSVKSFELIEDWINRAFGKNQAKKIHARLNDPDDELDIPHIMQLVNKLSEITTGNPTT